MAQQVEKGREGRNIFIALLQNRFLFLFSLESQQQGLGLDSAEEEEGEVLK